MTLLTKRFWVDAAERSAATAAQSVLAAIGVDQVSALELDYKQLAGIALGSALLAIMKAVALSSRTSREVGTVRGTDSWDF